MAKELAKLTDTPSSEEVAKVVAQIIRQIKENKEMMDGHMHSLKSEMEDEIKVLQEIIKRVKAQKGDKGDKGEQGRSGRDGLDGRDGRDGRDGEDGKDGDIKDLSPDEIRDSLELLKDDERLDISAIKGFGKKTTKLTDDILNRAIGIVDQRTSFLIQKVSNLQDKVNSLGSSTGGGHTIQDEGSDLTQRTNLNFVGAGVTVTDDAGNDATKVTISGGASAALNKETPVGDVDDTNTSFTVSNEPFFINVNGLIYEEGDGIYISYVAGTITLLSPVGASGFIKSYYA